MRDIVRIGCGSGFWGDSPEGPRQLVRDGSIDYLVLDYLAEITMSILARMKAKNPALGYATDFVSLVMKPLAGEIAEKRIRVVTNAGGVNPEACRDALLAVFAEAGVSLKVAIVTGDDLSGDVDRFRTQGLVEMFSGAPFPDRIASVNAYLGALPIAAALAEGADIVITGRCVDSAVVLGPLIHEFGWGATDYDRLSAGSLAGHILECGTQATGGIATDWREVVEGWPEMGFPIADCRADGSFEIRKPAGTGGRITPAIVAEQIVYEVGDPAAYMLPDVCCDWSQVALTASGTDRVRVSGAKGLAPSSSYKVSATFADGYRCAAMMMIVGDEAKARAQAVGEAILARTGRLLHEAGFGSFSETSIECLGAEASYGAGSRMDAAREVVLKLAVRHPSREALQIFAREIYPAATAMAQSLTGFAGGRPEPQPVIRLFSFLIDKSEVEPAVLIDERRLPVAMPASMSASISATAAATRPPSPFAGADSASTDELTDVPLSALAVGRSGDKGDVANIGVIARHPDNLPWLRGALRPEAIQAHFAHQVAGPVECFDWPGLDGLNIVMHRALGGGGVASLRHDPQGKAMAQVLMSFPVAVPAHWTAQGGRLSALSKTGTTS